MKKMGTKYSCFLFCACGLLALAGCATSPPREALLPVTGAAATPQEEIAALGGEDIPLAEKEELREVAEGLSEAEKRILKNIYFDFDKSELTLQSRTTLEKIADYLRDRPGLTVLIEGHCDERGTEQYNLALGERRALAARRYLVGLGIGSQRMQTISYGEERPLDAGHTEVAWTKNRRAEFKSFR